MNNIVFAIMWAIIGIIVCFGVLFIALHEELKNTWDDKYKRILKKEQKKQNKLK